MKYIFDFDDVLFNNTKQFKKHMYSCLEKAGVSYKIAKEYYDDVRKQGFTTRNFISALVAHGKINNIDGEKLYEKIMGESQNFTNIELLKIIKKLGKKNCYLVTHGVVEHQLDKIKRTKADSLFSQVIIVSGSKKEAIEKICTKHADEKILFIDDQIKRLEDIDFKKCSNLKTILYDEQGLMKLKTEIAKNA